MCTMYCLFVCPPADVSVSWFCRLEDLYEKIVMELMGKCNICLNLDNSLESWDLFRRKSIFPTKQKCSKSYRYKIISSWYTQRYKGMIEEFFSMNILGEENSL